MGWERRGGRRYYTRTARVGGRWRRTYVGGGALGELAAAADALRRANRRAALEAWRAEQTRREEADKPLTELGRLCDLLAHAALAAGGFHRHGGEWRRAMTTTTTNAKAEAGTTPEPAARNPAGTAGEKPAADKPAAQTPAGEERVRQILRRAMQGDRTVLAELGEVLDGRPDLWRRCGDLAGQAQAAWIQLAAGDDLFHRESLLRKAAELLAETAGPDAPPLERLLAERVVATWLQVHYADAAYALAQGMSPAQDAAALRRQNAAQARHLAAVKQLAVVRKLLKAAPSPLEMLKFPVNEGSARTRPGLRRAGLAAQPVAN